MGAGVLSDVFLVAFRLPNFLRRIFAEGAFSVSFVPLFSSKLEKEGKESAINFASDAFAILMSVLIGLNIIVQVFMPELVALFTPGFVGDVEKFDMAVLLTRITFPYIIFISAVALYGGILNSMGKFAAFAAVPILLNLCLIISIYFFGNIAETPAHALSYGVMIAGIVQLAFMIIAAKKVGVKLRIVKPQISDDVKKLATMMVPAVIGASVAQINLLVDTIIASYIPNAVSYLYYADRISQLPLSVIGVAVGTALLPLLSRHLSAGRYEEAKHDLNRAIELTMILTLPAAAALLVINLPIISVLFERGEFSSSDSRETASALAALGVGIPAFVLVKVFAPAFFAEHDTKTPVKIALFCIALNIILNLMLKDAYAHVGIALATSISSWANAALLGYFLYKRERFKPDIKLNKKVAGTIVASLIMSASLYYSHAFFAKVIPDFFIGDDIILMLTIITGSISLAICLILLKVIEYKDIMQFLCKIKLVKLKSSKTNSNAG